MIDHLTDRQVAALRTRTMPPDETFELLEHAASCPHCSELLVSKSQLAFEMASVSKMVSGAPAHLSIENLNDFVDGSLPPFEVERIDAHLAECQACSRDVFELRKFAEPADARLKLHEHSSRNWIGAFFTLPRMGFAMGAIILIVALSGWLAVRNHKAGSQYEGPDAVAKITGPVKPRSDGQHATGVESGNGGKARGSMLAIALTPGLIRGGDAEKSFQVPADTETLRMRLTSRSRLTAGRYEVLIVNDKQQSVWHGEVDYRSAPDAIVLMIPAQALGAGRYVVSLSAVEATGASEDLEEYTLHIKR